MRGASGGPYRANSSGAAPHVLTYKARALLSDLAPRLGRVGRLSLGEFQQHMVILREVLTDPRFQDDKLTLRKGQLLSDMKSRNDDTADIEARERGFLTFGEGYYLNRYTKREYFTIWTAAWLSYALWLTIGLTWPKEDA